MLTSCLSERLTVHNQYMTADRYASVHVETPDPRKLCPSLGQRLIISWWYPKTYEMEGIELRLWVRYNFTDEDYESFPLVTPKGNYIYSVMDDEYFFRGGITTYLVQVVRGDEVIDEWRHVLWEELIISDEIDETENLDEAEYDY